MFMGGFQPLTSLPAGSICLDGCGRCKTSRVASSTFLDMWMSHYVLQNFVKLLADTQAGPGPAGKRVTQGSLARSQAQMCSQTAFPTSTPGRPSTSCPCPCRPIQSSHSNKAFSTGACHPSQSQPKRATATGPARPFQVQGSTCPLQQPKKQQPSFGTKPFR